MHPRLGTLSLKSPGSGESQSHQMMRRPNAQCSVQTVFFGKLVDRIPSGRSRMNHDGQGASCAAP